MQTWARQPAANGGVPGTERRSVRGPLEQFFRDYVEVIGGACDEVEPQVYDVLLPDGERAMQRDLSGKDVLRVAFDPEAIPEHPGAQLASFGTPLVDRLLQSAMQRGRGALAYLGGLNLAPHDLSGRVRRVLTLAEGLTLSLERARPLHFTQAVFWLRATFVSDQKEEEILPLAVDLHSGRQVRHLDALLDYARLSERPSSFLAEAPRPSVAAVYPTVRQEVVRTVASLANTRRRELSRRVERQIERMTRYYRDLRSELDGQIRRARDRGDDLSKYGPRREAIDREERLRVAELRRKSTLRVELRLANLLVIQQPKLLLRSTLTSARRPPFTTELALVWDPLTESLEAATCPRCQSPTYVFQLDSRARLACPACHKRPYAAN
jgi:hypothetical protein